MQRTILTLLCCFVAVPDAQNQTDTQARIQEAVSAAPPAISADVGAQRPAMPRPPIIDMHMHAFTAGWYGTIGMPICAGDMVYLGHDPADSLVLQRLYECPSPLLAPRTDDELVRRTLAIMEEYNVFAVTSGPITQVRRWRAAAPERIIPGVLSGGTVPIDSLRTWVSDGTIAYLGEFTFQYRGIRPTDSVALMHFELAQELDVPIGLHVGAGPMGAMYLGFPGFRMSLSNPLLLEETLVRYPRARVNVMHAGWPMLHEMMNLLYGYPQVYVDIGHISWMIQRAEFHRYLRTLVEAGFGKRIMFGTDMTIWPEALRIAIEAVESAPYLSEAQKRDIFYNNAARFLRLSATQIARHHSR